MSDPERESPWPTVVLASMLIAAIVALTITGHDSLAGWAIFALVVLVTL